MNETQPPLPKPPPVIRNKKPAAGRRYIEVAGEIAAFLLTINLILLLVWATKILFTKIFL